MNDASTDFGLARDRHLFGPGPKRILSLDGGGVRGAISVAFLERIEKIIQEEQAKRGNGAAKVRLGDYFDLVGGTSTGAVIAGALALGNSTAEIKDFYLKLAPRVFKRPFWRVPGLQAKFDAGALREEIDKIVKDRRLDSPDLITGLCVVTKRLDTGSPWLLANNPRAPYWPAAPGSETDPARSIGNSEYRLANLVRASTAAPHFFDPEILPIVEDESTQPLPDVNAKLANLPGLSLLASKLRLLLLSARKRGEAMSKTHGLFVDGGVTPYNNPTMALLMMTQLERFALRWPLGPDKLSITSIGTGTHRTTLSFKELGWFGPLRVALSALLSLMSDIEIALARTDAVARRMPAAVAHQFRDRQSRRRRAAGRKVVQVPALRRAARAVMAAREPASRFHRERGREVPPHGRPGHHQEHLRHRAARGRDAGQARAFLPGRNCASRTVGVAA